MSSIFFSGVFACNKQKLRQKGVTTMKKEFVLGVEEALTNVNITLDFEENDVTIPLAVLDSLYNYKGEDEKKVLASKLIDYVREFPYKELTTTGCVQRNGSVLRVVDNGTFDKTLKDAYNLPSITRRVFQVCHDRKKVNKEKRVILIAQNPAVGIQAAKYDIESQPRQEKIFPSLKEQYTGVKEVDVSQTVLKQFSKDKKIPIEMIYGNEDIEWVENLFVIMKAENGSSLLGRYTHGEIVELKTNDKNHHSYVPKNAEQSFLLEALEKSAEEVPIVIVKGEAGTGKTFCALSAAINQLKGYGTRHTKDYVQILVAAPTVTIDEDIGYLPGEKDEKISPYLGGIYDNLAMYFRGRKSSWSNAQIDEEINSIFQRKLISIQALGFLRGRSIQKTIFIIDECQNIKPSILKDIVTRVGKETKLVLLGDPSQVNKPGLNSRRNGLVYVSEKFKGSSLCYQITLNAQKSVRSELAKEAVKFL